MKYFTVKGLWTFGLPDGTDREKVSDELAAHLIDFAEDRGGEMGGGFSVQEVDEEGKPVDEDVARRADGGEAAR